ncbi:MAG: magnesium transporter [Actinobacteria bacterium BACL4 MAG-120820-bin23]|jgi:CBS domain-containing protein|uniref:magnesium transporter MgtE N-terminal domain-containing protein n=1 Tax=Candidatus Nanopelagicus sp. TaxID=2518620 RepID=UPI000714A543|nr:MAG: magnesium transporter [Actinobacteria bacterium BACL4 MAG-120820-bin23]KRO49867.1 MAG: magnesium transporter [Actinobacteria bacterium BACL4 MAG-121001-bin59]KRO75433.1 MAG: magnesium transporter [Actinobacteria bacterium BACL4 MAG-120920-bin74]KRO91866.1 MAG: magnesium transporter [Actinobacteria bacterium BACL4 MAG-120507-bin0]
MNIAKRNELERVFLARLAGTGVFDPNGDQVGKVRDAVATLRSNNQSPRILGIIVEVPPRKRIFVPITRVTSINNGHVIITGLLNMRRFEPRTNEITVLSEMLDRSVTLEETNEKVTVEDIAMELSKTGDWFIERVHIMKQGSGFRRRGSAITVKWSEISGFTLNENNQGVTNLLGTVANLRAADLASVLHDLNLKRRVEVARALNDERLADVLEEMDEASRVELLAELEGERAADVLEEMDPDDAADLLREVGQERAQLLLALMEPEDAEDVKRLMHYEDYSAGGMMTTEPIVLTTDSTVAEALAKIRSSEVSPGLAAQVFVCRQPIETPTGRFMGVVHIQRLLREPPSTLLGGILDTDIVPLSVETNLNEVSLYLASYNLLSVPIVDSNDRLLGAVTVDDVLDHLLPENWRQDESLKQESEAT